MISNTSSSYNWIQWSIWKYIYLFCSISAYWDDDRMDSREITFRYLPTDTGKIELRAVKRVHYIYCMCSTHTNHKNLKRLNEINYNGLTSQWHCDHAQNGQSFSRWWCWIMMNSCSSLELLSLPFSIQIEIFKWKRPQSIFNTKWLLIKKKTKQMAT